MAGFTKGKIETYVFSSLQEVYDAIVEEWVEEDVSQFTVSFEDDGWVLSFPRGRKED